jgi:hypothetical protein
MGQFEHERDRSDEKVADVLLHFLFSPEDIELQTSTFGH